MKIEKRNDIGWTLEFDFYDMNGRNGFIEETRLNNDVLKLINPEETNKRFNDTCKKYLVGEYKDDSSYYFNFKYIYAEDPKEACLYCKNLHIQNLNKEHTCYVALREVEDEMIDEQSWIEFRDSGLLWFINNILHLFGYSIVYNIDNGKLLSVYPARVKFRGFSEKSNTEGYIKVSEYLNKNIKDLLEESKNNWRE